MKDLMLICYGDSEENLKITLKTNIIGVKSKTALPPNQLIFLIIKRNKRWYVVAKSRIISKANTNPFGTNTSFFTYNTDDIEQCTPFDITDICRKELGNTYGLVLIIPRLISAPGFLKYISEHFVSIN